MAKDLKNEELEQVAGGSIGHVSASDIINYVGQDMKFTWGLFGCAGGWTVHIDRVLNAGGATWVKMTFYDPAGYKDAQDRFGSDSSWEFFGNNTCEFDYSIVSNCTWLE